MTIETLQDMINQYDGLENLLDAANEENKFKIEIQHAIEQLYSTNNDNHYISYDYIPETKQFRIYDIEVTSIDDAQFENISSTRTVDLKTVENLILSYQPKQKKTR